MNDATVLPAGHKLHVHAFHAPANAGTLREHDRGGPVEADIVDMAPAGAGDGGVVSPMAGALSRARGASAVVGVQGPVRLDQSPALVPEIVVAPAGAPGAAPPPNE